MKSFDQIKTYTNTTAKELYEKGFFACFHSREQFRGDYLKFTTDYILKKYGAPIATQCFLLSVFNYSTFRPNTLRSLQQDEDKNIFDMRYQNKTTYDEMIFIYSPKKKNVCFYFSLWNCFQYENQRERVFGLKKLFPFRSVWKSNFHRKPRNLLKELITIYLRSKIPKTEKF